MSRWDRINQPRQSAHVEKMELTGVAAMCRMCPEQAETVIFLPDVQAITWKCEDCGFINVIEDFKLI